MVAKGSEGTPDFTVAARVPRNPSAMVTVPRTEVRTTALAANKQIGRFELIRELARGGMGQVFLARDTTLGRKVAIKFLLEYEPDTAGRFLVEARATARCTHENIVTIYEVGEHEGMPYMVLEYLEGHPLNELLEQKPSPERFAELMVAVVRALERAHEHGIVHRDLKPPNIFITDRGQVKVLDFGIAQMFESLEQRVTGSMTALTDIPFDGVTTPDDGSKLVGTLPYMSPEQWGTDAIDTRTDLWAVGIMFWRALAPVHPAGLLKPENLRTCLWDLATPLPSLAIHAPQVPARLVAIVDRCLAKRKADRYANATALLADLQAFLGAQRGELGEDVCPYRGLAAFGEDDARFFFGRASEIRMAASLLDSAPIVSVVGATGVGKSSFIHAGLIPALRASGVRWSTRVLRPGRAPLRRLVEAIGHESQRDNVLTTPGWFGQLVRLEAAKQGEKILFVVDQLEELFTLCEDEAERAGFLGALRAAADDPSAPVRVVLSMRADFIDRLATYRDVFADLSRGLFFLAPPEAADLRETIVRPAELAGYRYESSETVDDLLRAGSLPLLSFAASRLWDTRDRERKLLTVAAYRDIGGVGGAFAKHADRVMSAVATRQRPLLRALMLRLVTPEGTRAVADTTELRSLADDPRDVDEILALLGQARLIHVDQTSVEIVHEMLLTEWPRLRRWLEDGQAVRGFVAELQQAARNWSTRGRPSELVWHGAVADEAIAFSRRHVLDLSTLEREYLDAVLATQRHARRRRVALLASVFAVLGLVIAGGSVALVQISAAEQRAHQQEQLAKEKAESARFEAEKAIRAEANLELENAELKRVEAARAEAERKASTASEAEQQARLAADKAKERADAEKARAEAAKKQADKATQDKNQATADAAALAKKADAENKAREAARKIQSDKLPSGVLK